jgi:hypothetical protein
MNILEKEIEELLFHGIENVPELLDQKGFKIVEGAKYYRQLNLGSYGISDIVGVHLGSRQRGWRSAYVHVIELKKEKVDFETLNQAVGYARAIQKYLKSKVRDISVDARISLIGKTIDLSSSFCYLPDIFENIDLYTYELDFYTGIKFKQHEGYYMTNGQIPDMRLKKDWIEEMAMLRYYRRMARNTKDSDVEEVPF